MRPPENLHTYTHHSPSFIVRPYEVQCLRCAAQPWNLCYVLARAGALAPRCHPQRIELAQKQTRYHVYEMSKGRLLRTFAIYPNAWAFAADDATLKLQEDIDAGTAILAGVGAAPPSVDCILDGIEKGLHLVARIHPGEVRP